MLQSALYVYSDRAHSLQTTPTGKYLLCASSEDVKKVWRGQHNEVSENGKGIEVANFL
tara:strand:- start:1913 stop:2086 length:174 start_codon:yes stop_codon:yes gene_type:complete